MPHDIVIEDGRAMMMYAGREPWHGLGTALNRPATSAEAIASAGLDWEVGRRPLLVEGGLGRHAKVDSHVCLVREDRWAIGHREAMSVVGKGYEVLQNREAFSFFDRIVGDGRAVYETAGALDGGRIVWVLARLPKDLTTENGEKIRPYVLLANGHGRQVPVSLKLTAVRVVCANTLGLALERERGRVVHVAHNASMRARLGEARELLGLIDRATLAISQFAERLRRVELDEGGLDAYVARVFPDPVARPSSPRAVRLNAAAKEQVRWSRTRAKRLSATGAGNSARDVAGTLWAAYNGVTDHLDHSSPPDWDGPRLLRSVWFGQRAHLKNRAGRIAEEIAIQRLAGGTT